jgi:SAM-dependent methyltransferase
MRIGIIPENPLERIGLALGLAPTPLGESWFTFLIARTIMLGTKLGFFEALAAGPTTVAEIAARAGTHPRASEKLLVALAGCGYVRSLDGGRWELTQLSRRWLLETSPQSCRDKVLFQFLEWDLIGRAEEFLRSGEPLELHQQLDEQQWALYQRGMRSGVEPMVGEVVRRLKLGPAPARMLDVGGSHGFWSVAFCRRYDGLRATVLDLPQAIAHAAPILAREQMGDRVVHRAGDALVDDLGEAQYDFILLSSLVHHFDDATNRALMQRCARALKPGGVVAIFESVRVGEGGRVGQIGGVMDLFFALTSRSGTWSAAEMQSWQRDAGLKPRKLMRLRMVRDLAVQAADKT